MDSHAFVCDLLCRVRDTDGWTEDTSIDNWPHSKFPLHSVFSDTACGTGAGNKPSHKVINMNTRYNHSLFPLPQYWNSVYGSIHTLASFPVSTPSFFSHVVTLFLQHAKKSWEWRLGTRLYILHDVHIAGAQTLRQHAV